MRTSMKLLSLLMAAALISGPGVAAQPNLNNPEVSTPTTLYFHIFDTFNKFVINTQAMNDSAFEVGGVSFPTIQDTPANEQVGNYDLNTIYGTSTAGPVEYDFIENGKPRFHPEPGIAAEVTIDQSVDPVVYLYIEVRDFISFTGTNAMPFFTFRAQMKEGDDAGRESETLEQGDPIMRGETTVHIADLGPANAAAGAGPDPIYPVMTPNENGVIEIAIPMDIQQGFIPKTEAFNIRLDWYQGGDIQEDAFAEGYLRLYADPDHLPRLELNIMNPIFIEFIHPQVAAGILLIHTGVNSPWGTYDVDVESITVSVEGPSTPLNLDRVVAQNQNVHGLHDQAAEITYLWRFRDEGAKNGDYTINFGVSNNAGDSRATGSAGFVIEGKKAFGISDEGEVVEPTVVEEAKGSPAIGLLGVLGLLALALVRRRS